MMPSAASAPCSFATSVTGGSRSSPPISSRKPAAPSAKVDASATTRRDDESDASSGTTTSQIAENEPMPPVPTATAVTSPVSDSEESTCALSYWPVRERK